MGVVSRGEERAYVFGRYSIAECKLAFMDLQIKFITSVQEFEYKMRMKAQAESLVDANGKAIVSEKPSGIVV